MVRPVVTTVHVLPRVIIVEDQCIEIGEIQVDNRAHKNMFQVVRICVRALLVDGIIIPPPLRPLELPPERAQFQLDRKSVLLAAPTCFSVAQRVAPLWKDSPSFANNPAHVCLEHALAPVWLTHFHTKLGALWIFVAFRFLTDSVGLGNKTV